MIPKTHEVESPKTVQTEGRNWFVNKYQDQRVFGRGLYHEYDGVIWRALDDRQVQHDCFEWLSQAYYYDSEDARKADMKKRIYARRGTANDIAELAAISLCVKDENGHIMDNPFDRSNLFNFKNGTFDLDEFALRSHQADDYLTSLLPYQYDKHACCPRFEQFLQEIMVDDRGNTAPELIDYLQRWVGSLFTPQNYEQCMMLLFGSGANGKSVLLDVITAMIGRENVFTPNFNELNPHTIAEMIGKRLCIASESPTKALLDSSTFKAVVSGDLIQARFIYKRPFMGRYTGKIAWACNELPRAYDQSDGLWRRIKVLPFNRHFRPNERDEKLTSKLFNELPGIFNWALIGYSNYLRMGLAEPELVKQKTREYREQSDKESLFISEMLITDPTSFITTRELYDMYKTWCLDNGYKAKAKSSVGMDWKRLGLIPDELTEDRRKVRIWRGVSTT